jgi:hypothetical protein
LKNDEQEAPANPGTPALPGLDLGSPEERIMMRFEALVEAVLYRPPPSAARPDPDWNRLFRWCHTHRNFLATRARSTGKLASPNRVDLWLRELASPPKGVWDGVRQGAISYIRLVGIPPRGSSEAMFTNRPAGF